ncbi:hypothetical protein FRB94_005401 [Tulasnella sp. JGI-2019a]|nr:hypothetical protein FRB94_005401 [Tulasnella sp. JGI-2019a]KAG9007564.1 hypothetical protein FRB93_007600 [Tulasnella sp. JGI-2019a]
MMLKRQQLPIARKYNIPIKIERSANEIKGISTSNTMGHTVSIQDPDYTLGYSYVSPAMLNSSGNR